MTSIADRFPAAATSAPPTAEQRDAVAELQAATRELAEKIDALVPEGRDKSLALTHLEDTLMRANRGVFTAPPRRRIRLDPGSLPLAG